MAAALAAALAAPAGAQPIDTFVSTGNAQARWIKDTAAPSGSDDRDSIELAVTARSALDLNDAAWVSFLGLPSAPPATPPSFLYKVSDPGGSGGSVRLVMRFSDGGYGFLRPVTLQAGRWVRADGAGGDWESNGGRGCGSSGITYARMLACHPGSKVTSLEIINDSGWLHSGPFKAEVDEIRYGGELISKPAPPVLGKSVNVAPVSGDVVVRLPEGAGDARASRSARSDLDRVDGTIQGLPVGSRVDTRRGAIKLISSRGRRGRQSGRFSGGVFTVGQIRKGRNKGLTTLRLKTTARRRCNTGKRAGRSQTGSPHAAASRRRRGLLRRLKARAKGRFRTRGRYSSAIVRGTVWTIEDRCEGTLVRVREGTVAVRDLRRRRTVLVRAGQSHLAKAPGP